MHAGTVFGVVCLCLSTAIQISSGTVLSMDKLHVAWNLLPMDVGYSPAVRMTLSFNLSGQTDAMWVGLGFGYDNFNMNGHKQTIVLTVNSTSECSVRFAFLESGHRVAFIEEVADPWGIKPLCFITAGSPSMVEMTFVVGGFSSIEILDQPMYLLLAYGKGSQISYHGQNWDFKKLNFLGSTPSAPPVDPWLLTHGIVFILVFAVLMPITSFLILFDRDKYFVVHKVLGIVITALLILGWAVLSVSNDKRVAGAVFAAFDSSSVALLHSPTGIAAKYLAIAVCLSGVMVAVIRMPKKVHLGVRLGHGIGGGIVSVFGPLVVWNGWVRLSVLTWEFLETTPLIWLSLVVGLLVFLATFKLFWRTPQLLVEDLEMKESVATFSFGDLVKLTLDAQAKGCFVFTYKGFVVHTSPDWTHPGGRSVLVEFVGQDIASVFQTHSPGAARQLERMKVGRLVGQQEEEISESTVFQPGGTGRRSEYDEDCEKIVGLVTSVTRVTVNEAMPVKCFVIDHAGAERIVVGSKVRLSLPGGTAERTYTVACVSGNFFSLYIKIYPLGELTPQLSRLTAGDLVHYELSPATVLPNQHVLRPRVLLAGGTGIVPMLQYLDQPMTHLIWWVRDESDLFLTETVRSSDTVHVLYTQGGKGRICHTQIQERISLDLSSCFIIMSGPPGFIQAAQAAVGGGPNVLSLD